MIDMPKVPKQFRNHTYGASKKNKKYHFEIGFPTNLNYISGLIKLEYSKHAISESNTDKYGIIKPPEVLNIDMSKLIEIEVENKIIVKYVYRATYNEQLDIVIVFIPQTKLVKTVWFNMVGDEHYTLDRKQYNKPKD